MNVVDGCRPLDGSLPPSNVVRTVTLAVALVASGCSITSVAGEQISSPTSRDHSRFTDAPNRSKLPPRPEELRLEGANPANVFPAEQRAEFGVNQSEVGPKLDRYGTLCTFSSRTVSVGIANGQEVSSQYSDRNQPGPDVFCSIDHKSALVILYALKARMQ